MGFPMRNHAPPTYRRFFTTPAPYSTKVVKWIWYTWTYQKPVKQAEQVWPWGKPSSVVPIIAHRRPTKCHSEWCNIRAIAVCSVIPQGSILGPSLFLLYVNDLPDAVEESNITTFADDKKIYKEVKSAADTWTLGQKTPVSLLTRQNARLREYPGN